MSAIRGKKNQSLAFIAEDEDDEEEEIKPVVSAQEIEKKFSGLFAEFVYVNNLWWYLDNFREEVLPNFDIDDFEGDNDIYIEAYKNTIAQEGCLAKCKNIQYFLYYINSVTADELISFIKIFFLKFDRDGIYMLNFKQFTAMMETMARKFSVETMEKYFLMMDKYNFNENSQKDRVLQQKTDPNAYFGPFVMECVFKIFKGDNPVQNHMSKGGEYLTDFWKFLPFVFNMMMLENFKKISSFREKFFVGFSD